MYGDRQIIYFIHFIKLRACQACAELWCQLVMEFAAGRVRGLNSSTIKLTVYDLGFLRAICGWQKFGSGALSISQKSKFLSTTSFSGPMEFRGPGRSIR